MCLQDEQSPINIEIVESALSSAPRSWDQFSLDMKHVKSTDPDEMGRATVSLHNGDEPCRPEASLYDAAQKLVRLYHRYGIDWSCASFEVSMIADGKWQFDIDFQY